MIDLIRAVADLVDRFLSNHKIKITLDDAFGSALGYASSLTAMSFSKEVFHFIVDGMLIPFVAAIVGGVTMHYLKKFLNRKRK